MREGSLRQFAPQFLQPLIAVSSHPSPILVRPFLLFPLPLALPVPPPTLRFGKVTPQFLFVQFRQHRATVIALVGHHLFHSRHIEFTRHRLRLFQRFVNRRRVPFIGRLQRKRQDRSAGQIHRMLGLVRQVGAAVFHLGDPRVRIAQAHPHLVRSLLLALPIQPRQLFPCWILGFPSPCHIDAQNIYEVTRFSGKTDYYHGLLVLLGHKTC